MVPFSIKVSYRLPEYLSIVWEHAPTAISTLVHAKDQAAQSKAITLLLARLAITAVSVPMFFYKISRVGQCQFDFTESGVTRISKLGELQTPWSEVKHVYALSRAFLIVKPQGGMPVPYRCMSPAQHEQLGVFFTNLNTGQSVA